MGTFCDRIDASRYLAENILKQRLQEDPEDIDALLQMALLEAARNQPGKAVETYFTVLRHDPRNFHAYHNLGILYKNRSQFQDSLYCLERALALNSESDRVHFDLGLVFTALGRIDKAKESFGRALSLNPDFSEALDHLLALTRGADDATPLPSPPGTGGTATAIQAPAQTQAQAQRATTATMPQTPQLVATEPTSDTRASATPRVAATTTATTTATASTPTGAADKGGKTAKTATSPARKTVPRTQRQGGAAEIFNQAMEALENANLELALEFYVRSVIADRELLSEPESGLIQQALDFLRDRPNRLNNGLFYRGYLTSIAESEEKACRDLRSFLQNSAVDTDRDDVFVREARNVIDRCEQRQAELLAEQARRASEALMIAELERQRQQLADADAATDSKVTAPTDTDLQEMDATQIVSEAERLIKAGKTTEAITILDRAAIKFPADVKLLMVLANAHTDLFLANSDQQAGKQAQEIFIKAYKIAQPDSVEAKLAANMAEEIEKRLR